MFIEISYSQYGRKKSDFTIWQPWEQAGGPYPTYVTVNDTDKVVPVVQASAYTKYMGHLRLNFDLDTGDLLSPVQGGVVSVPLKFVVNGHLSLSITFGLDKYCIGLNLRDIRCDFKL